MNSTKLWSATFIRAARACSEVRRAALYGVAIPGAVVVDFPNLMAHLRRVRAQISPNDSAQRYKEMGVDVRLSGRRLSDGTPARCFRKSLWRWLPERA